jgi:hypothetical protein
MAYVGKYQPFGEHLELMLKGLVNENFKGQFYTFIYS